MPNTSNTPIAASSSQQSSFDQDYLEKIEQDKQSLKTFMKDKPTEFSSLDNPADINQEQASTVWKYFQSFEKSKKIRKKFFEDLTYKLTNQQKMNSNEFNLLRSICLLASQYDKLFHYANHFKSRLEPLLTSEKSLYLGIIEKNFAEIRHGLQSIHDAGAYQSNFNEKFSQLKKQIDNLPVCQLIQLKQNLNIVNNDRIYLVSTHHSCFSFRPVLNRVNQNKLSACLSILNHHAYSIDELRDGILFLLPKIRHLCFHQEYHYYQGQLHEYLRENHIMPANQNEARHRFLHNINAEMIYNRWLKRWPELPSWSEEEMPIDRPHPTFRKLM